MNEKHSNHHPKGLWYLSAVSALYSFSVGTILSLLILYLTERLHMDQKTAYVTFAAFMALMYTLPLLGGFIGGQFGYKKALCFSAFLLLLALGFLQFISINTVFIGLGLFALGHGFYLPNLIVLLGRQYAKDGHKRDSGFTLYYALMNVGYLISFFIGGYIQTDYGFHISFILATVPLMIALLSFAFFLLPLQPHTTQSYMPRAKARNMLGWLAMIGICILASPLCILVMSHADFSKYIIFTLMILIIIGVLFLALRQQESINFYKLLAYVMLAIVSIGFWSIYFLEPSLLTLFIQGNVNRHLFGHLIPSSTFLSFNPMFTISLGAVYGALWLYLGRKGKDLSVPTKFVLSLFSMCLAFVVLYLALELSRMGHKINLWWVIPVYFFLSTGELLISPIGQGAVGRLAPAKLEGLLMGSWLVFVGASATLSGFVASWAAIPHHTSLLHSDLIYSHTFLKIAVVTLGVALVSFALLPFLKRAMYKKKAQITPDSQINRQKGFSKCPS